MWRVYSNLKGVKSAAIRPWPGNVDSADPHIVNVQLSYRAWVCKSTDTLTYKHYQPERNPGVPLELHVCKMKIHLTYPFSK